MFDIFDKSVEINHDQVISSSEELEARLAELQREMKAAGIPTVVVFEGWSASGKGTMIGRLIRSLDPRGFKVFSMTKPNEVEKRYPVMRRYWMNIPTNGNISVFDRSWYRCIDFKEGKKLKEEDEGKLFNILDFESQLTAEGYLLIKFFLHISADEQKADRHRHARMPAATERIVVMRPRLLPLSPEGARPSASGCGYAPSRRP